MRKLRYFGAAIILVGSVSVAVAQERAPQHSGFGTGVGESQGSGTRSRVFDQDDMERYLQPRKRFMVKWWPLIIPRVNCTSTWAAVHMTNVRPFAEA